MSEALNKVAGIRHLPIFPLPLVMLPGEALPLHIFEERYRKMLTDVENERKLFGITLFEPAESFIVKPAAGSVGCVAEIKQSEMLPDGRSNIITSGVIRYRLTDYIEAGEPYLIGDVTFFEDASDSSQKLSALADSVFDLFERMAKAAFKMSGGRGQMPVIQKTDAESLSFLITAAFNFENEKKYRFLEMTSTLERLTELKVVLDAAVDRIEESAEVQAVSKLNGHSKKKIDI